MSKKPYYITTPIYYPSGNPHIGHCYTTVACDSIARFRRMQGYDVIFLTGTDEHGLKIEQKAAAKGITPKEYVDEVVKTFKALWEKMHVSYDRYIRTTDDYHVETVQKIFKRLYDLGYIYKGEYKGKYCTPCESFWTESQLDENGCCPECHREVTEAKEEAYFMKMAPFAERIEKLLLETDYLQPKTRAVELVNNFIKPGLEDLCVSRTSFTWGIPVTFDTKHVVYVWVDALSNYISALGYENSAYHDFDEYWPADVHMVAKDIMRFHAIIWPAMLMALDLPLPKQVFGHPWLLVGEGKMSKSKGNVIYADDLVRYFGVDAVRYIMLHEMPFAQDGTVTYELMIERINSDLANILGNLVNRTLSMTNKYFGGLVHNANVSDPIDDELIALAKATPANVQKKMDELRVADAIDEIFALLRRSNKYIDETMPWALGKDETKKDRLATVLYNLLESIRIAAILLESYLPETSKAILDQLNTQQRSYDSVLTFGQLEDGIHVTSKPQILFARIDEKEMLEKIEAEQPKKAPVKPAEPAKPQITIDDFAKIEMKVGQVLSCEKHPKADKLLVSQIDIGEEKPRQIVSGIAGSYKPEQMVGKKVVVITNLAPAKLRGVESQGMILAGMGEDQIEVLSVEKLPVGSTVR